MRNIEERTLTDLASEDGPLARTLTHIVAELEQADDIDAIPSQLVASVVRNTPFDKCWAGIFDVETRRWTTEYHHGFAPDVVAGWARRTMDLHEPSYVAVTTGKPVIIPDTRRAAQFSSIADRSSQEGYHASLYIPVRLSDHEWTVLSIHRTEAHQFSPVEQSLAAAIASFAAVALRNTLARDRAIEAHRRASETVVQQNEQLRQHAEVQRRLLQAQVNGGGVAAMCELIGELLDSPLVLLDRLHQVTASVGLDDVEAQSLADGLAEAGVIPTVAGVGSGAVAATIGAREVLVGTTSDGLSVTGMCLTVPRSPSALETDGPILELGCLYISLELVRRQAELEAELRLQDDFVDALVQGGDAELARRSSILGVDLKTPLRVYRARVGGPFRDLTRADSSELVLYLRRKLLRSASNAVVAAIRPRDFVAIVPDGPELDRMPRVIRHALSSGIAALTFTPARAITVGIGIGETRTGVSGLEHSHSGATRALEVLEAMVRPDDDLSISHAGSFALLTLPSEEQKREFCDRYLTAIVEHDRDTGSDLLATLRAFFAQVGNVKRTAEEMFLHISTVRHRLARIEKLAGISLRNEDERLCLQLALRISEVQSARTVFDAARS